MLCRLGGRSALLLVLAVWVGGCARDKPTTIDDRVQDRYGEMDRFDVLLLRAGVDLLDFPARESWSVEEAKDLSEWLRFSIADGNISAYGPRVLSTFLLEEGIRTGKPLQRRRLLEALRRHEQLVVLAPDGHLVDAHTGRVRLCVGHPHIQNGVPQAGGFKVDAFYTWEGGAFREVPNLVAPVIFTRPLPKHPPERVASDQPR